MGAAPLSTARRDAYPNRPRGENVTDITFRIRPGVGAGAGAAAGTGTGTGAGAGAGAGVGAGADQEPGVGVGVGPALPRLRNPARKC